ncbi:hypothetical protein HYFRA_00010918 [Hymenoscyphus fraxineus]|uniref:Uncharacterized protein n=1 Tax=Hymenoscyphus fraxineus TaxID=746836 RepID=A0A9N9PJD0_9HELO|nr:hypothetical protein HYFRA_00010918 [Hymenoscyphus fraxineus]
MAWNPRPPQSMELSFQSRIVTALQQLIPEKPVTMQRPRLGKRSPLTHLHPKTSTAHKKQHKQPHPINQPTSKLPLNVTIPSTENQLPAVKLRDGGGEDPDHPLSAGLQHPYAKIQGCLPTALHGHELIGSRESKYRC